MNAYSLPTTVSAGDQILPIRSSGDFRVIIDVCIALDDHTMTDSERIEAALTIFYDVDIATIQDIDAAVLGMMEFVAAGEDIEGPQKHSSEKLVDWEKDAVLIISGINHVVGHDVRSDAYMHWWSFVAAYLAIGDSVLATVVSIRRKRKRGKKLEKFEQEFVRDNPQYFGIDKSARDGAEMLKDIFEDGV